MITKLDLHKYFVQIDDQLLGSDTVLGVKD